MCLEQIRAKENLSLHYKNRTPRQINFFFTVIEDFSEKDMILKALNPGWLAYDFFDKSAFMAEVTWRRQQVKQWFKQYDKEFFAELDIWDIDWGA